MFRCPFRSCHWDYEPPRLLRPDFDLSGDDTVAALLQRMWAAREEAVVEAVRQHLRLEHPDARGEQVVAVAEDAIVDAVRLLAAAGVTTPPWA